MPNLLTSVWVYLLLWATISTLVSHITMSLMHYYDASRYPVISWSFEALISHIVFGPLTAWYIALPFVAIHFFMVVKLSKDKRFAKLGGYSLLDGIALSVLMYYIFGFEGKRWLLFAFPYVISFPAISCVFYFLLKTKGDNDAETT